MFLPSETMFRIFFALLFCLFLNFWRNDTEEEVFDFIPEPGRVISVSLTSVVNTWSSMRRSSDVARLPSLECGCDSVMCVSPSPCGAHCWFECKSENHFHWSFGKQLAPSFLIFPKKQLPSQTEVPHSCPGWMIVENRLTVCYYFHRGAHFVDGRTLDPPSECMLIQYLEMFV